MHKSINYISKTM